MNSLQRYAIVVRLVAEMRNRNSWCGETHVQKAAYLLQELTNVPTDLDFVLYKHGPFSFQLRDELTAMRADNLLELRVQQLPYGPKLIPTPQGECIEKKFPKTLAKYNRQIHFAADAVGDKGVNDLEKLATALFILNRKMPDGASAEQAELLHELKPHISTADALEAIAEAKKLRRSADAEGFVD